MKSFTVSIIATVILCVQLASCVTSSQQQASDETVPINAYDYRPVDERWKKLSLREKIGQTMIIVATYEAHKERFGSIEKLMQQYPVSGVFVPNWEFSGHQPPEDVVPYVRRAVSAYQDAVDYPLIITEDFERGMGEIYADHTELPTEMAIGAANKPELAALFGHTITQEAKTHGVNWLLHPVADLQLNPLNNLIVERATGDDPKRAYPLLKAQMQAMHSNGVISTVKHFPGDGATMKNQHLITSANNLSFADWQASYGNLFQKLINDGAPSIMIGHIRFPAYQSEKDKIKGVLAPATLSREIMVDLLKEKMQFNGVVMSDALNMGGVSGYYKDHLETSIESFKAGVDMVLWPSLEYMDAIEERIKSGEIPMARLDEAVSRIWGVREKFGLLEKKQNLFTAFSPAVKNASAQAAQKIAEHAVTLVEDRNQEIPLSPSSNKKIGIIHLSFDDNSAEFQTTVDYLKQKGFEVGPILHNPGYYDWQHNMDEFDQYDKIFVLFANRNSAPMGQSMLKGPEAMGAWTANMLPFEKIIAISYGNPVHSVYYLDTAPIKINGYGFDPFTQRAIIDGLLGEIPFVGTSPVDLNSDAIQ